MTSPTLDAYLAADPTRCDYGYAPNQHPGLCACGDAEWHIFTRALRQCVRADRTVHVNDVRPLVRGLIEPKHIGQLWVRAARERLIRHKGWEPSTDTAGGNGDKPARVYDWIGARP